MDALLQRSFQKQNPSQETADGFFVVYPEA